MRRAFAPALAAAVLCAAGACTDDGKPDPKQARELARVAVRGDAVEYRATYRYTLSGPLADATRATMQMAQKTPDRITRIEASTSSDAPPLVSWHAALDGKYYVCNQYGGADVSCIRQPAPEGLFGYGAVDDALEAARRPGRLANVRRTGNLSHAGERGPCFEATTLPVKRTPRPSPAPRFEPSGHRYELCYSRDGILLRMRRSALGPVPTGLGGTEFVFEATEVVRAVVPGDLKLPGPVRDAAQLAPTPTRSPKR